MIDIPVASADQALALVRTLRTITEDFEWQYHPAKSHWSQDPMGYHEEPARLSIHCEDPRIETWLRLTI